MAKDNKGTGTSKEKEKKAALKGVEELQSGIGDLRDLHAKLGKHLDEYDKNADALYQAIAKDAQAEMKKRMAEQAKLQTKIFEIMEGVTKNKARSQDKNFKALDAYIRG